MIFPLIQDFADSLAAMPSKHPRRRILALLEEALPRDVHFIGRHPTTLFQCLWNTCWWYHVPQAAAHYDLSKRTSNEPLPWDAPGPKLYATLEVWRRAKDAATPGFPRLRSLRSAAVTLGTLRLFAQARVRQGWR